VAHQGWLRSRGINSGVPRRTQVVTIHDRENRSEGTRTSALEQMSGNGCHRRLTDEEAYLPTGWPGGVGPPGSQDCGASAVAWPLGLAPHLRGHSAVRHPVMTVIARHTVTETLEDARQGYRVEDTEISTKPRANDSKFHRTSRDDLRLS
jgi:hypothetical protein